MGTTISLLLPRHGTAEAEKEASAPEFERASATTQQTVLVVDDEPLVRALIVDVVEELGHVALEASDGPEAMAVLRSVDHIDLLITDVGLPNGMNGRQIAEAARTRLTSLPVLFVTGYADTAVMQQGNLEPGMAILTKPFTMTAMAECIHDLINKT